MGFGQGKRLANRLFSKIESMGKLYLIPVYFPPMRFLSKTGGAVNLEMSGILGKCDVFFLSKIEGRLTQDVPAVFGTFSAPAKIKGVDDLTLQRFGKVPNGETGP